jgi:hypothetical protein
MKNTKEMEQKLRAFLQLEKMNHETILTLYRILEIEIKSRGLKTGQ